LEEKVVAPVYKTEGSVVLTMQHPLSAKAATNLADKHSTVQPVRSLLADYGHRVCLFVCLFDLHIIRN
jgi:hypothetical protein